MSKHLHIVSFDIPYPANYGGAIDVFYKIKCLHEAGVQVILHCFEYGDRKPSEELEKFCKKVYYYKRKMQFTNHFSFLPFNVKSRISKELKQNLLLDEYPILFEVLHSAYLINDKSLVNRFKLFRPANIEHDYFLEIAKSEKSFFKKIYLKIEALKLKKFESRISDAHIMLPISKKDVRYFKKKYEHTQSVFFPAFHEFDEISVPLGKGNYILYHGNLSISENYTAAIWLIENVFSKLKHQVIIAGLNPPIFLQNLISKYDHISLKANCSSSEMKALISEAHINCLYTSQSTGLKLKLLNVLFSGRFVLANSQMLLGSGLEKTCDICNTPSEYLNAIDKMMNQSIDNSFIENRKKGLVMMSNETKTEFLVSLL